MTKKIITEDTGIFTRHTYYPEGSNAAELEAYIETVNQKTRRQHDIDHRLSQIEKAASRALKDEG